MSWNKVVRVISWDTDENGIDSIREIAEMSLETKSKKHDCSPAACHSIFEQFVSRWLNDGVSKVTIELPNPETFVKPKIAFKKTFLHCNKCMALVEKVASCHGHWCADCQDWVKPENVIKR